MIDIFTTTRSILSKEFIESFPAEKLALTLFKVGQETGVEFNNFSIVGQWNALLQAHKSLEHILDNDKNRRYSGETCPYPEIVSSESHTPPEKNTELYVTEDGRQDRKPGSSEMVLVSLTSESDPVFHCQHDRSRSNMVNQPSNLLNVYKDESVTPPDDQNAMKTDADKKKQEDALVQPTYKNNKNTNEIPDDNACNDDDEDYTSLVHDEGDDSSTDIYEKYMPKENTVDASSSLQSMNDPDDLNIKMKRESVETDVLEDQRKERKSKPDKPVQGYLLGEDKQCDEEEQPKKKSDSKQSKRMVKQSKSKEVDDRETEFKCDMCDYVGNKQTYLKEHKNRKHRNKFTCDVCQKQFGFNTDLNKHKKKVHVAPSHFCDVCQKFYKSKRAYDKHVMTHKEDYIKPSFSCELCPKSFSTKYVLTEHTKTEHLGMKKSYKCPTCSRSFTQKHSYILHAKVYHLHDGKKAYTCDVCGKTFTYKQSLRQHKLTHDTLQRYQCHVCSKTFRQTTSLRIHMKEHKDTKDYREEDGRRGRKPGSSVMRSVSSTIVPDPVIVCQYNKSNIVKQELMEPSNELNVFGDESVTPPDDQGAMKTDEFNKKQEDTLVEPTDSRNDINESPDDNSCNDDDDTSFVHDDCSTDTDEKYLPKDDTGDTSSSMQYTKDPDAPWMTVKQESIETDVLEDQAGKEKSKPDKPVQGYLLDENEQSDEEEQPKKSDGKQSKRKVKQSKPKEIDDTETEFKCDMCDYIGNKQTNLKEHKNRKHRNKFTCDVCQKQFGLNSELNKHKNRVHADPSHFCDVCQKFYKSKNAYDKHVLTHEENYVKPSFSCELCLKSFSTMYVLGVHIKTQHLGMKKSYICPTCGRSFTQKNSYIMHANAHAGIKPYICDVCGKAFTYDKALREHQFIHDELRRFQCLVCSKTFRQSASLHQHMKVHKETKDYVCTTCGKGFTQKQALLRHERIHSGDKPFKCSLCDQAFSDSSIRRRHMMHIHKIK